MLFLLFLLFWVILYHILCNNLWEAYVWHYLLENYGDITDTVFHFQK